MSDVPRNSSAMKNLIFLCHRIPFPPNKGDKIRSFHILRELAQHYSIALGTFIDDPQDEQYVDELRKYCSEVCTIRLDPTQQRLLSLRGFVTGEALSVEFYRHAALRRWLGAVVERTPPACAFVFSSTMAQYLDVLPVGTPTVVDYVDVDSEKWRAYAAAKPWPLKAIYKREWHKLAAFESAYAERDLKCVFVSSAEAVLFRTLQPAPRDNIYSINNGVDLDYFTPTLAGVDPYLGHGPVIVFTGAMDYWANVDAVSWFADEVLPDIRNARPNVEFWIVGSKPTDAVKALSGRAGVTVTGRVEDIRPYLAHAQFAVAPMRIARGVQNKVLEALAMGKIVVGTSDAFEGLALPPVYQALVANDAPTFVARCLAQWQAPDNAELRTAGLAYVAAHHDWAPNVARLRELLG